MIKTIKTTKFKITALVLVLTLTVSCVLWNATRVHAQELEIDNTNVQTFAGARAITDNGKLVGTAGDPTTMSVFVTGGSLDKYNANNMKWEHNGTEWQSTGSVLFAGVNFNQKIYACSPYVDGSTGSINVVASQQTDWLVATATDLRTSDVNLTMTHALTKLVINPTFGSEVDSTDVIDKIEVKGMYASGTLTISDNTWSGLSDANATLEMVSNELLVIPMENCTSFDVVITMSDGRTFTTTVNCPNGGLAAGTQYNINLQVGQDMVTLGSITAEPWTPSTGGGLETE